MCEALEELVMEKCMEKCMANFEKEKQEAVEQDVAEKNAYIAEQDASLAAKDAYIKELEAKLAKQNQ